MSDLISENLFTEYHELNANKFRTDLIVPCIEHKLIDILWTQIVQIADPTAERS